MAIDEVLTEVRKYLSEDQEDFFAEMISEAKGKGYLDKLISVMTERLSIIRQNESLGFEQEIKKRDLKSYKNEARRRLIRTPYCPGYY
ncbi:MAG: hypothetical protein Q7S56_00445 [Nanoarchaeota archaeon]|nr:hypothetical protein [Nanoarchaeota archaeon]